MRSVSVASCIAMVSIIGTNFAGDRAGAQPAVQRHHLLQIRSRTQGGNVYLDHPRYHIVTLHDGFQFPLSFDEFPTEDSALEFQARVRRALRDIRVCKAIQQLTRGHISGGNPCKSAQSCASCIASQINHEDIVGLCAELARPPFGFVDNRACHFEFLLECLFEGRMVREDLQKRSAGIMLQVDEPSISPFSNRTLNLNSQNQRVIDGYASDEDAPAQVDGPPAYDAVASTLAGK